MNNLVKIAGVRRLVTSRCFCDSTKSNLKQLSINDVNHFKDMSEFRIEVSGHSPAYLRYSKSGESEVDLYTTVVPSSMEGKGVAKLLVRAAIDFARDSDLSVVPTCWYVDGYLKRNPQEGLKVVEKN